MVPEGRTLRPLLYGDIDIFGGVSTSWFSVHALQMQGHMCSLMIYVCPTVYAKTASCCSSSNVTTSILQAIQWVCTEHLTFHHCPNKNQYIFIWNGKICRFNYAHLNHIIVLNENMQFATCIIECQIWFIRPMVGPAVPSVVGARYSAITRL